MKKEQKGNFVKKDCLIYGYEEKDLKDVFHEYFEKKHDIWIGKSLKRYDVLILRDPFNTFASKLKRGKLDHYSLTKPEEKAKLISLWKSYAKEYLGITHYLRHDKSIINYNRWFSDVDYRKNLAQKLGLKFTDKNFNKISRVGGGDAFNGLKFDGQAHKMKVLERWKHFTDHKLYRNIFKDRELVELSNKIFGPLQGAETLLNPFAD